MRIGLFGAVINNGNLGCQALTYSVVRLLDDISKRNNKKFEYYVFEEKINEHKTEEFKKRIGVSTLSSAQSGNYHDILREVKHWNDNRLMTTALKECDAVIDLTQGDSFSDIYEDLRFGLWTADKERVEKLGVPLILGSQTYGPFNYPKNRERAAKVIQKANAVIARDKLSANYVQEISGVNPLLTCDLAFRLPFNDNSNKKSRTCKRVGLNISGLLSSFGSEGQGVKMGFKLITDYDQFVDQLLDYLVTHGYEVHLIGHVGEDYEVNVVLKKKYPSVILAPEFDNPMDAKSYISSMDLFVGSRMHATIAALTSDTPVVPVAYSRKFTGLFDSVDYPYVVDLQKVETDEALKEVVSRIENYGETKSATQKSYEKAMQMNEECYKTYEKIILGLLK